MNNNNINLLCLIGNIVLIIVFAALSCYFNCVWIMFFLALINFDGNSKGWKKD